MKVDFTIKFAIYCIVAALFNAIAIVSVYLAANQRFDELDIVINSYVNGSLIALVFYFLFFYLPNYRAHLKLSKFEGEEYIECLKAELSQKHLYKIILNHWFLKKWQNVKENWGG